MIETWHARRRAEIDEKLGSTLHSTEWLSAQASPNTRAAYRIRPRGVRRLVRTSRSHPVDGRHGDARRVSDRTRGGRRQRLDDPPAVVGAVVVLRLRRPARVACDQSGRRASTGPRSCQETRVRRCSCPLRPWPATGLPPRRSILASMRSSPCSSADGLKVARGTRARHRRRLGQAVGDDDHGPATWRDEAHRPRPRQCSCRSAMHRPTSQRPRLRQRTVVEVR